MFILYNILQLLFLVIFFPFILVLIISQKKLRNRIPVRLGIGLKNSFPANAVNAVNTHTTFWIHALSVGEVTSAVPLIAGIRKQYPESQIVLSVATRTGKDVAKKLLYTSVDQIIDGPLDLLPVIALYCKTIQPDIFILIETDFWPNILYSLQKLQIPTLLVNGRVSEQSMANYSRFRWFFKPMFARFSLLCLQTEQDRKNMLLLGITPEKLFIPGNLKFDFPPVIHDDKARQACAHLLPEKRTIFIAGSTHDGEEEILLTAYKKLRQVHKDLFLIIVPRNPHRAMSIKKRAEHNGMTVTFRSDNKPAITDVLIIDSIGELTIFYSLANIAFVGGSLVRAGGHNPIEPASIGIPILFGPNMQDFAEIATSLILSGGAVEVTNTHSLQKNVNTLLKSSEYTASQGKKAYDFVQGQRGVVSRHLDLMQKIL